MFRHLPWSVGTLALILSSGLLFAAPDPLEELVSDVLKDNPELKAAEAELAVARGERRAAGQWKNPEVAVQYGERRVRDSQGELSGEGTTRSAAISQTFEFPGKGSLRKAIADKNVEIAEIGLRQFRLALAGRVRQLAFQYATADSTFQIAQEISDRSSAQVELLRKRATAGVQGLLELRIIEGNLAETRKTLAEFEQSRHIAQTELNTLRGLPPDHPFELKFPLSLRRTKLDLDGMLAKGMQDNLQLKIRELEVERGGRELAAARLEAAPDFVIGPFFSKDHAGDTEANLGAQFSMTLPLWDSGRGKAETARARQDQSAALLQQSQRQVTAEIVRRYHACLLAQKQLEEYSDEFLGKMADAARLADRHYRLGAINVQTYLEIQRQYLNTAVAYGENLRLAHDNLLDLELLTGGRIATPDREQKRP